MEEEEEKKKKKKKSLKKDCTEVRGKMGKRVGSMLRWPGCKGFLSVVWLCEWVGQRGMNKGGEKQESRWLVGNVA